MPAVGTRFFHFRGSKKSASILPSDGLAGYLTFIQSRLHSPRETSPFAILSPFDQIFVASARLLGRRAPAAEIGTEVLKVVPDVMPAAIVDVGIDAVDRAGIIVIQPRGEYPQPSQLAALLVRKDVVWIVGPRAGVAILPTTLPGT